ncbi:Acyltransferase family protein associated with ethylmalonyl-CoA pathway [Roseibacterium elongatum DSM 19469]|uniref:Glycerol-3-phosphate acyltransferase n=1 Tax=Roseicyclus elongatus DSM 19469 TaxID=1294273 RepID=W8RSC9_9RHOB|nr:1-acyl-sn-glycerol-3-phosphate acyltransferase [Roseibacterium elongatum]AHM04079.1 Acyltransferase family protein associated with ethylmalonyl-CoA pathway [Roseibacterium elongatum DSM 19469]
MTTPVTLPLWLFILILLFAAVTFASHFLFPSVRWFLRRRLEAAVEQLNTRLARPIQPFKLARRMDTVRRLIYDPEVAQAIADHAHANGIREDVAFQKAERYAREIVPGFSAFTYFSFAIRVARLLSQSLYRVRLAHANDPALESVPTTSTVIFVMNHRSNMDYVLVTWLVAERSALAYAVGEWARVWPLRQLVRAMGGYFIRRRYNNALYRRVLARYVQMATEAGVTQAVFPEGGLSRTGALGKPKLGLISYILDGFQPGVSRDVVFVPVALNYDRVMEDRNLIDAHLNGTRRFRFSVRPIYRYLRRQIWLRLTGRFHRYGYAAVSFGDPLSLTEFLSQGHVDDAEALGANLMDRIARVMPVTPVPLVAHALAQGVTSHAALTRRVAAQIAAADAAGITVHVPRADPDYTVEVGLRGLMERRMITRDGDRIEVTDPGRPIVAFYANSVAHLLDPISETPKVVSCE